MATSQTFLVLSLLLEYPSTDLIEGSGLCEETLRKESADNRGAAETLAPLIEYLRTTPQIELEEEYVRTFDHSRKHSLYLYEQVYGEDAMRGFALADLRAKYARAGFYPDPRMPPDYAPFVLEYLSLIPSDEALKTLERITSFQILQKNLETINSVYACAFRVLADMAPSEPRPLPKAPVRDMDEAMEMFGVDQYGSEPLSEPGTGCPTTAALASQGGRR